VSVYEHLDREILRTKDSTAAAIGDFVDGFTKLRNEMSQAGYTTQELGKLETLYSAQRIKLLKDETQPFRDFIKEITTGSNSGLSIAGQYDAAKAKFSVFESDLKAGKTVDQSKFTAAGQTVFDLSRQLYGSTTDPFLADRQRLVDASNSAIGNVEKLAPEVTIANAVNTGAAETVTQLQKTNDLLAKLLARTGGGGALVGGGGRGFGGDYGLNRMENF
jgi:hypothetical protein